MSKKSSYFKSKKGFSLLELLCAVVIMAMVVSATATGLAVSFESIMMGSAKDKASAKAQEYCDIIMTYVEYTPCHDYSTPLPAGVDTSKNKLFDTLPSSTPYYLFDAVVMNNLDSDISGIQQLKNQAEVNTRTKADNEPYFIIEKNGYYLDASGVEYVSYQVTVYMDYGNGKYTTYCTGSVTKPKYAT